MLKVLGRGCGAGLVGWAVTTALYYFLFLGPRLSMPLGLLLAAFSSLGLWVLIGTSRNLLLARADGRAIAAAVRREPFRDGAQVAALGPILPLGEPLRAAFSGEPCVAYEAVVERQTVVRDRQRRVSREVSRIAGSLALARSAVSTPQGRVEILGFPLLELVARQRIEGDAALESAGTALRDVPVEKLSAAALLRTVRNFEQMLADDDGATRLDWRSEEGELGAGDRLYEQRVAPGQTVCVLGRWSASRGGLVPDVSRGEANRLVIGDAATARRTLRRANTANLAFALVYCGFIHALTAVVAIFPPK